MLSAEGTRAILRIHHLVVHFLSRLLLRAEFTGLTYLG